MAKLVEDEDVHNSWLYLRLQEASVETIKMMVKLICFSH